YFFWSFFGQSSSSSHLSLKSRCGGRSGLLARNFLWSTRLRSLITLSSTPTRNTSTRIHQYLASQSIRYSFSEHSSGDELLHNTLIHTGQQLQICRVHTLIDFVNSGVNRTQFDNLRTHAGNKAPV